MHTARTGAAGGHAPLAPGPRCPRQANRTARQEADELLTIEEVIAELRVSRSTFYRWRRQGTGPPAVRLPSGAVRIRRSALRQWLRGLDDPPEGEHAA